VDVQCAGTFVGSLGGAGMIGRAGAGQHGAYSTAR